MTRLTPLLFSTLFRLLLWQLLTADLSVLNVMIGLALALLIPRARSRPVPMAELWQGLGRALLAVPQAYGEAFALIGARRLVERDILHPHHPHSVHDCPGIGDGPRWSPLPHSRPAAEPGGRAMTVLVWGMVLALLIPIALVCRPCSMWDRMAAFASIAAKVALIVLVVSVVRGDPMLGLVGVVMLSAGNAGMVLLAHLLRSVDPGEVAP
jgi:multicomponent Na+:H+ antiporter subunit F